MPTIPMAHPGAAPAAPARAFHPGVAAGFIVAYVFLERVSYIHPIGFGLTPWSPPAGLGLALLLVFGLRYWPALLVAALAAAVLVRGHPVSFAAVAALSAVLAAGYTALAAALLKVLGGNPRLATLGGLWRFSAMTVAGSIAVCSAYIVAHVVLGLIEWPGFFASFMHFWVGELIGIIVTTPFLLVLAAWRRGATPATATPRPEAWLQAAALVAVLAVLFALTEEQAVGHFYLLFLPLIWVAVRSGFTGATAAVLGVQLGVVVAVQALGYSARSLIELQQFMLVLAFSTLFLGMASTERRRVQEALVAREVELREKQADLERALRLGAAAEMASAIAHELNQPLSAAASYLRACELMLEDPGTHREKLADALSRAAAEARRAGEVTKGLREFFRSGTGQLESIDPRGLVDQALETLRNRLQRHGVRLVLEADADLPRVRVDRVQVATVLQNLVGNAIDAMGAGGEREIAIAIRRHEPGAVRVSVRDTGPGLDAEAAARLFQPFRSRKPHGMGLGLALSRTIVESHGGRLWHENADRGAVFSFTLPAGEPESP